MTTTKCIVPNCKNDVGVPFPKDEQIKEKWLDGLQLDVTPKQGSIVCFSHFSPSDLKDDNHSKGRRPIHRLKRGAIPCIPDPDLDNSDCVGSHRNVVSFEQEETEEEPEQEKMCRACLSNTNVDLHLLDVIEKDITIAAALKVCMNSLNISDDDEFPKYICKSCLINLKVAYKFIKKYLATDLKLKMYHRKRRSSSQIEISSKKIRLKNEIKPEHSPLELSSLDEFEVVYEDSICQNDDSDFDETTVLSSLQCNSETNSKLNIDDIEKNMEEIHGDALKNIESEVMLENSSNVDDDLGKSASGNKSNATVEDILSTLEEGTVANDRYESAQIFNTARSSVVQPEKKIVIKSNFPTIYKKDVALPNIKLPKGVKIKPVQTYSKAGRYPSTIRIGVYDSMFIQADEYLFEIGLAKGNMRHLRCSVPTCPAQAKQRVHESTDVSLDVDVVSPHNHPPPNEATKKKQMFLCLMRKKMQTDRTLNIRMIYEDACVQDPEIKQVVPLRNVINEICRHQLSPKTKPVSSFDDFFLSIESDAFEKLHFTHNNQQFYQEKFYVAEDASMAVLFANMDVVQMMSDSKVMYIDASFKIDTNEDFKYQLVTVLVWIDDSYYPILFTLVNKKSQLIFRKIFTYLRNTLAPQLRPQEIITDYEANLYYALSEIYVDSTIGGSVFYYTQNLYKKICSLNLSRDLETNSYFRNVYHMLLMLPLLPVNTILDGLNSIELEAKNLNISGLARPIFDHVRTEWMLNVTPELFCAHKLENRINENVIAPFKKLRDFLLLTKGKLQKTHVTIMHVIEKIIELEAFLRGTYSRSDKKSFGRDLSSYQKKNVLRAWQFIEDHPKIEISNFFSKVLGYIKCMENQLWIWGFYRYDGDTDDILINATHFSIVSSYDEIREDLLGEPREEYFEYMEVQDSTVVMEAVIDQDGVLQSSQSVAEPENTEESRETQQFESEFVKYVYQ